MNEKIAENIASKVIDGMGTGFNKILANITPYKPEILEAKIWCPTGELRVGVSIDVPLIKGHLRKFSLPIGEEVNLNLIRDEHFRPIKKGWTKEGRDIIIPTKELGLAGQRILLDLKSNLTVAEINDIVDIRSANSPAFSAGTEKYWLHAGIYHPESLKKIIDTLEIERVQMKLGIKMGETFSNAVPKEVENYLSAKSYWTQVGREKYDAAKVRSAQRRLTNAERKLVNFDLKELINLMERLSIEQYLVKFFEVSNPFSIERTIPFELTTAGWPNMVRALVNTDISLDTPVAKGDLIFKKDECDQNIKNELDTILQVREDD